jgi:DNA-binding PadR family transcriptional regulator
MKELKDKQLLIWQALSTEWKPGLEVIDNSGVKGADFYVTVRLLEDDGLVESEWGEETEERGGARVRLYRRVTGKLVVATNEDGSLRSLPVINIYGI